VVSRKSVTVTVLTLAASDCEWRAAAPGPFRLPRARPSMSAVFWPGFDQGLTCTESATSEYSTTSQCLSALLGRPGRVKLS